MGRHTLVVANSARNRWSVPLAVLVVAATAVLVTGAGVYQGARADTVCCAEIVAAPAAPTPPGALTAVGPAPGELVMSARAATRDVKYLLPAGVAPEEGLQVKTILAARAISALFPEILSIGGVRADSLRWHPNGLALDVMVPDYQTAAGRELGDRIASYALTNADRFGLENVIWRQVLYMRNGMTRIMDDYGSDDANHYTHVHIATDGGGFPTGSEIYFTSADGPGLSGGAMIAPKLSAR